MAKRTVIGSDPEPPKLVIPRTEAQAKLLKQLEKGKEIQNMPIQSEHDLRKAKDSAKQWMDYVAEMLLRFFDNDMLKNEFIHAYGALTMAMSVRDKLNNHVNTINAKVAALESITNRLELIPEPVAALQPPMNAVTESSQANTNSRDVFIVHGHDDLLKVNVARFIQKVELNSIILHEQANGGRTLIEKLEHYSGVGFAVIIMTPDDMGYPINEQEKAQPRARQNVVAELGFFGYPLKAGQLTYDCRYSTMHGMPVTGGRGFRGLKPLWYNSVPP